MPSITVTLNDTEQEEVLFALKLRRHQKRAPYSGVVDSVWNRIYCARCAANQMTPDPLAQCYDNTIRVNVVSRERW